MSADQSAAARTSSSGSRGEDERGEDVGKDVGDDVGEDVGDDVGGDGRGEDVGDDVGVAEPPRAPSPFVGTAGAWAAAEIGEALAAALADAPPVPLRRVAAFLALAGLMVSPAALAALAVLAAGVAAERLCPARRIATGLGVCLAAAAVDLWLLPEAAFAAAALLSLALLAPEPALSPGGNPSM